MLPPVDGFVYFMLFHIGHNRSVSIAESYFQAEIRQIELVGFKIGDAFYGRSPIVLHGNADADFAGDKKNSLSTYGNVIYMGRNPISWRSQKISTVVLTTCAAEYIALSNTAQHMQWLREFMTEITGERHKASVLRQDNAGAEKTAESTGPTKRAKYISVRHHFVRDHVRRKEIQLKHVPSEENTADIFTKPLPNAPFNYFAKQLIYDCSVPRLQGAVEDHRS